MRSETGMVHYARVRCVHFPPYLEPYNDPSRNERGGGLEITPPQDLRRLNSNG